MKTDVKIEKKKGRITIYNSLLEYLFIFILVLGLVYNLSAQTYATLPFADDFSATGTALGVNWSTSFSNAAGRADRRNLIGTWPKFSIANQGAGYDAGLGNPAGKGLAIYNTTALGSENILDVVLALNLNGATNVLSTFHIADWGSNNTNDALQVYFSNDGGNNYTYVTQHDLFSGVYSDGFFNSIQMDISALAAANSIVLTSTFKIKFSVNLIATSSLTRPTEFSNYQMVYIDNFEITGDIPLPVELISFTVKREGNYAELYWQTASEVNNDRFDIEYSYDGIHFTTIGSVSGYGNSFVVNDYSFIDNIHRNSTVYYRLKQIDFDAKYTYSKVIVLEALHETNFFFNTSDRTLYFEGENGFSCFIYDSAGKEIYRAYSTEKSIQLSSSIPSGYYFVIIYSGGNSYSKKIIL